MAAEKLLLLPDRVVKSAAFSGRKAALATGISWINCRDGVQIGHANLCQVWLLKKINVPSSIQL